MPFTQKEINELWEFCMSRKFILTISDLKNMAKVVYRRNYAPDFQFPLRNNVKISEHAPILTYSNHA